MRDSFRPWRTMKDNLVSMQSVMAYILGGALVYGLSCAAYFSFNKGMAHNAKGLWFRRLFFTVLASFAILGFAGTDLLSAPMIPVWTIFLLWITSYPMLYHWTNRNSSPEYENCMDIIFAVYMVGWLGGIKTLMLYLPDTVATILSVVLALLEFVLILLPVCHLVYYALYKVCLDANGMKILQETHYNEIIEYVKSFPVLYSVGVVLAFLALLWGCVRCDLSFATLTERPWGCLIIAFAVWVYVTTYVPKKRRGVWNRTGLKALYDVVMTYRKNNSLYESQLSSRMENLEVTALGAESERPSTIMMVIGESMSKDYMSSFSKMEHDTTPWLRSCRESDEHFIFFPHVYSCATQTVPTLECSLTEKNYYNNAEFYNSCSIVDIAHKLGYQVHWYSNQGHLGAADTPITLVANTSEVAKWTRQELNKVQYDESLLEFLKEVDPSKNNFVVLHLKGNHFNFLNRYPSDQTVWGEPNVQDNILNYENSIHYTDSVLHRFYDYAHENLNLQAMLFFSDHADVPDKRRCPNFDGYARTRIPMFVYLSDEYRRNHPTRYEALTANREKCFTNDLAYELMCGIFDVASNHFDESNSLASSSYKWSREELLTNEGRTHIVNDNNG